jgi:putative ABC transport system ATP-binding protein
MPLPIIELRHIGKVFRTDAVETHAMSDVNLVVQEGEFLAVTGPSGSGKSTLLAILGLLDAPTSGEYRLAGTDVSDLDAYQRALIRNREIGFIFQAFNLIGNLTVAENVGLPLFYRGLDAGERAERVATVLATVDMTDRAGHFPGQLSGGQQQRAAIARALVGEPSLLLADEPTGNLDSENGAIVMRLLTDLHAGGATIFMVTHDEACAAVAGRRIHMLDGRLSSNPEVERLHPAS